MSSTCIDSHVIAQRRRGGCFTCREATAIKESSQRWIGPRLSSKRGKLFYYGRQQRYWTSIYGGEMKTERRVGTSDIITACTCRARGSAVWRENRPECPWRWTKKNIYVPIQPFSLNVPAAAFNDCRDSSIVHTFRGIFLRTGAVPTQRNGRYWSWFQIQKRRFRNSTENVRAVAWKIGPGARVDWRKRGATVVLFRGNVSSYQFALRKIFTMLSFIFGNVSSICRGGGYKNLTFKFFSVWLFFFGSLLAVAEEHAWYLIIWFFHVFAKDYEY